MRDNRRLWDGSVSGYIKRDLIGKPEGIGPPQEQEDVGRMGVLIVCFINDFRFTFTPSIALN